jgi:lanosterol synthase
MARPKTNGSASNGATKDQEKVLVDADLQDSQSDGKPKLLERTDYSRWRLLDVKGRQTWEYLEDDEAIKKWPQSTADKYFLGIPTVCTSCLSQGIC